MHLSLVSTPNECVACTFNDHSYFCKASLTQGRYLLYLPSSLPTRAVLHCGLSAPALSISVSKRYHFCIFLCFWVCTSLAANRDLDDRGLPAGGSQNAVVFVQSKTISNDQELIQSDPTSCPQNQKGNN